MTPREKPRRGRQVATGVPVTRSANRAQDYDEMSSNGHYIIGHNIEENMFDRFAQRLAYHFMATPSIVYKRFSIERLKALGVMTFKGTINQTDVEKWLSLIEKYFGVMECLEEKKVKLVTFLL